MWEGVHVSMFMIIIVSIDEREQSFYVMLLVCFKSVGARSVAKLINTPAEVEVLGMIREIEGSARARANGLMGSGSLGMEAEPTVVKRSINDRESIDRYLCARAARVGLKNVAMYNGGDI